MAIFGPGSIKERTTGRRLSGRPVEVLTPISLAPVPTVEPVFTNTYGDYDPFETVDPEIQHVYLHGATVLRRDLAQ